MDAAFAKLRAIKAGDTVADLGSGAGNDFVARALTGDLAE